MGLTRTLTAAALAALALFPLSRGAEAQTYPTRPVTMIVPFGAGGGTDVIARSVSEELTKALGQSIVVDPRPGANGAIGSAVVARAEPDGYTLLFTAQSTYSLNPNLMKAPPYDQLKDLVPVASIGRSPWLIVVPAESPIQSIAELVAYGKANPGKLAFPFWQSSVLVTGSTFSHLAGIETRKVPYKGQVEATTDFLGGRLPMMVTDVAGARSPVGSGKMRILGTTTVTRTAAFPEAPTLREQGFDVVTDSMLAVFAPAGTPKPVIERLNAEISKIIDNSETVRGRLRQLGLDPISMTPDAADAFVRSELTRWADMIQRAGLQKE